MKTLLVSAVLFAGVVLAAASAQNPGAGPVTRLDRRVDAIVPAGAALDVLIEDYFGSMEGPIWRPDSPSGYLLFSDQAANRIYKWDGKLSVFLEPAGYTGDPAKWTDVAQALYNQRLHIGLIGTNGLAVDREGRVIMCARGDRALVRLEKNGMRTTLASSHNGKLFNPPNDLAVKSDGSVYFTTAGSRRGISAPPEISEAAPNGVYRWKDGRVDLLFIAGQRGISVNGLAFSPDEKYLYVASGKVSRFTVQPDGTLTDGKTFADGESDGMKVDSQGNLFYHGHGGLWIVAPDGTHLGTVAAPLFRNLAFGDADRKTLSIGIQRGLARLRLSVAG